MFKKIIIILTLFVLSNCSAPGTALLGPAFTGATTKSLAQATVSFGTNQIVRSLHSSYKEGKDKVKKIAKKLENFEIPAKYTKINNFHK